MQNPSSTPQPPIQLPTNISEMDPSHPPLGSALFDWSDFLDFNLIDDPFSSIPIIPPTESSSVPAEPSSIQVQEHESEPSNTSERVRKRDPRLVCSNYLAGRIPCACPEMDEKLAQEEAEERALGPGKKRARTSNAVKTAAGAGSSGARCQVTGCEADISELKGYHRRHRVCLRCAHATTVLLDGESKRYCQQCGKFHVLSDFDEGKRSCRRKLERHNTRRRRKPHDSKCSTEKEPQLLAEDISCEDDTQKDGICLSGQITEQETLAEPEGHLPALCSANGSLNIQSDSVVSFAASDETQMDREKENPRYSHSPPYCDNKSAFSSVCPTGRISFKLYDWNPAEFPRRLRHQIFQWLSSMPVELEGYIRPGCTIFTVFTAMPEFMWVKLHEESAVCIHDFVISPGNMLSGRGALLVYLNNMMFRVMKDGSSVMKLQVKEQVPKLHYVHPTCFEAGKPMEFFACGSNLLQPKFRFLVSFRGKYLSHDFSFPSSSHEVEGDPKTLDHQLLRICVPQTEPEMYGPAFIEVENESGVSNYIPILIGDADICGEMKIMQDKFDAYICSERSEFSAICSSCKHSLLGQTKFSEFTLDVAWLLKEPASNEMRLLTSTQIQRFINLLNFLIESESIAILKRVLHYVEVLMDKNAFSGNACADMGLLRKKMDHARETLSHDLLEKGYSQLQTMKVEPEGNRCGPNVKNNVLHLLPALDQVVDVRGEHNLETRLGLTSLDGSTTIPLLTGGILSGRKFETARHRSHIFGKTLLSSRPLVFAIAAFAVCFGVCVVFLHPQKVGKLATTIRRCLFDNS